MTTTSPTYRSLAETIVTTYFTGTGIVDNRRDLGLKVDALEAALPTLDLGALGDASATDIITKLDGIFDTTTADTGQIWLERYTQRVTANGPAWLRTLSEIKTEAVINAPVRSIRAAHPLFPDGSAFPLKVTVLPNATACGGSPVINDDVKAGINGYIVGNWCDSDGDMYVYIPRAVDFDAWTNGSTTMWSGYIDQEFVVPFGSEQQAAPLDMKALPADTKVRVKPGAKYASGMDAPPSFIGNVGVIVRGPDYSGDYQIRREQGGTIYIHFNDVEVVVEEIVEAKQDEAVAEPTPEPTEVERLNATIESLRTQVREARSKHETDISVISEWLSSEADDRDWCSEYEGALVAVNRRLSIGLEVPECDFVASGTAEVEVTMTVTVPVSAHFTASRRGGDHSDLAREALEEAELDDYTVKEAVSNHLSNGYGINFDGSFESVDVDDIEAD